MRITVFTTEVFLDGAGEARQSDRKVARIAEDHGERASRDEERDAGGGQEEQCRREDGQCHHVPGRRSEQAPRDPLDREQAPQDEVHGDRAEEYAERSGVEATGLGDELRRECVDRPGHDRRDEAAGQSKGEHIDQEQVRRVHER